MIQSLSVDVPTKGCINHCLFCVSRMHNSRYENLIGNIKGRYKLDYKARLEFSRENGCNTVMLTGSAEPQQNMEFIRNFCRLNRELRVPFRNIELQTTTAKMDSYMISELKSCGITTISVSVSCLVDDTINSRIINGNKIPINLGEACKAIKSNNINLRLSLNATKWLMAKDNEPNPAPMFEDVFRACKMLGADQVTFRKMYASLNDTQQSKWVEENCIDSEWFDGLYGYIVNYGAYIDTLEYGQDRYSIYEMSTVIDNDCMAKNKNEAIKYFILRPNCKLYTKWDDKGSLVF